MTRLVPSARQDDVGNLALLLAQQAKAAWALTVPVEKCDAVSGLQSTVNRLSCLIETHAHAFSHDDMQAVTTGELEPGRPTKPLLVHPTKVARRHAGRTGGRVVMLHAIAHIEFNAINLALDAAWRYPAMPPAFIRDWVSVAIDEARHFQMISDELRVEETQYGDCNAHDGLWAMARRTAPDLVARMALVPRVLEARGLDATPVIQKKLKANGDKAGVALLQILLDEEVRHVQIGDNWFRQLCRSLGKDPEQYYRVLIQQFDAPLPKLPLNESARLQAGFSESELSWLKTAANK